MKKVHDHLLQALFPVAAGWGISLTFAEQVDRLAALVWVPPEHPLYWTLATNLPPLVVIFACGIPALAAYRRWPHLLRVPEATPWPRLVRQLLVSALITLPSLAVISGLLGGMLDPGPDDPNNPQYIPLWFYTATMYPYAWTPVATILATAGWLRRRPV